MDLLALTLLFTELTPFLMKKIKNKNWDIKQNIFDTTDPTSLLMLLRYSPEKILEYQKSLIDIERDLIKIMCEDRNNARKMETHPLKRYFMLCLILIALIVCITLICKNNQSKETIAILSTLCGILGMCLKDI